MFLMGSIKRSLSVVISFSPRGCFKAYDAFSFCTVFIFTKIRSTVSGSMEVIEAKKFVMVGYWCNIELVPIVQPIRFNDGCIPLEVISCLLRLD